MLQTGQPVPKKSQSSGFSSVLSEYENCSRFRLGASNFIVHTPVFIWVFVVLLVKSV